MDQNSFTQQDYNAMRIALEEAHKALETGDVPIGAVLISNKNGVILGRGHNTREALGAVIGHAELNAITEANAVLGSWRLSDCTLYVTLEPCPMCAGAILQSRVSRVVFGAADPVAGAMGSVWALQRHPVENQHTRVEYGCLETECGELLKRFFRQRRE